VANDALNLDALNLPKAKRTSAKHMAAANDVMNQAAPNLPKAKRTSALHTEVANDAQIV
jgi:hypothetical protein